MINCHIKVGDLITYPSLSGFVLVINPTRINDTEFHISFYYLRQGRIQLYSYNEANHQLYKVVN